MKVRNKQKQSVGLFSTKGLSAALVFTSLMSGSVTAAVLEEVIVTAQKREQSSQDVGIAVTAFTGDQLDTLGFSSSSEIAMLTPGVHVGGNLAGQNLQYTIRGVAQNDFNDHTESPVAAYIDDTYIAMAQGQRFAMFDLERVEVLKGPQGTLFGRNATGGLVHFVSRKPTQETQGYAEIEVGDYDKVRVEGAVGGAITDSISGRLAAYWSQNNGYLDNDYSPTAANAFNPSQQAVDAGTGDDFGGEDNQGLRLQLLYDLNEDASLLVGVNWADSEIATSPYQSEPTAAILDAQGRQRNAIHQPADSTAQAFSYETGAGIMSGVFGPYPRPLPGTDATGYLDADGRELDYTSGDFSFDDLNQMETWGISAKLDWELEDSKLVWISDFKEYSKLMGMDVDSAPMNQLSFFVNANVWQFSQEIRLEGETDKMRWVTGLYGLHVEHSNRIGFKVLDNAPLLLPPGTSPADYPAEVEQETENYSIFAQMDYELSENLLLTAGLRIMQEEKDYSYALTVRGLESGSDAAKDYAGGPLYGAFSDVAGLPVSTVTDDDASDTLWTGKVQLDWTPTEDMLVYVGVNRGVKAGGFNAPIDFGGAQLTPGGYQYDYKEEVLTAFETGFKSTLFDGTTRLNGSAFYYDYKDYQGFVFAGVSGNVVNYDSTVVGAELELITSPVDGLDIMLSAAVFDAEVEDVQVAPGVFEDTEPSYAPPLQFSGLVRYSWPAYNGHLAVQADFSYSDSFYYTLRNYDSHELDDYTLYNARLSYISMDENWEVAAFVDNISDEAYPVMGFDISLFCGCSEIAVGTPRWWGMQVRRRF